MKSMPFYVPAYDTEAVAPWWEPGGHMRYEGERLREFLAGVRAVAKVDYLDPSCPYREVVLLFTAYLASITADAAIQVEY